ncbi:MAG: hypothetical protein H6719_36465 [Sandaracinaceae bacterium]|nr:hypothetical protein [Sandaracinaceae bacterium]
MSTPIKPPGTPTGVDGSSGLEDASATEGADGSFEAMVGSSVEGASSPGSAVAVDDPSALGALEADLMAGRATPEAAIEQLVQRALASSSGLSGEHRAALEAQLRDALAGDPTLAALRKDLERASSKA